MEIIEIKSRWTGAVLYSGEHADVKEAVEAAVKAGAYLCGANLDGAHLDGANLSGANLDGANLDGANLRGANLDGAYLRGANLRGANLRGANLDGAHLDGAHLDGANLSGADLTRADLSGANLTRAYLTCANLSGARLADAKVGAGEYWDRLAGSRPIVQIGPIGSRNDWLLAFWCGDSGVRISAGCQQQITEAYFLELLAEAHGEGEQANIHAQHYIEALAFAKRLLKDQAEGGL